MSESGLAGECGPERHDVSESELRSGQHRSPRMHETKAGFSPSLCGSPLEFSGGVHLLVSSS